MKILLLVTLLSFFSLQAKDKEEMRKKVDSIYEFEEIINIEATEIKNQNKTGTCWTFAGNSFLESELLRMGKGNFDLSEMFIVRMMYPEKADNYVRYHGKTQFGQGAVTYNVLETVKKYGIVPESVYSSRPDDGYLNHSEMFGILNDMLNRVVNTDARDRTNKWKKAFEAVLDVYMGTPPKEFEFEGKRYTPKSFADYLGLNADDYIDLTSFTHHPFYKDFVLEVPDNFSRGKAYNIQLHELMRTVNYALENGYTIDWGADVSEPGFSSDYGLAINPTDMKKMILNKDEIKWDSIYSELNITQEERQEDFDNYLTQDDHGMHIIGIAKDKLDRKYLIVKNSWGSEKRGREGYLYVSYSYFMHKTTSITLHKDSIPKVLREKLGI